MSNCCRALLQREQRNTHTLRILARALRAFAKTKRNIANNISCNSSFLNKVEGHALVATAAARAMISETDYIELAACLLSEDANRFKCLGNMGNTTQPRE